jgi:hypothetical protein
MNDPLELLERLIPAIPQARQSELFGGALQEASRQLAAISADIARLEEWQHSVGLLSRFWDKEEEREVLEALQRLESVGVQVEAAQDREQLARIGTIASDAKQRITIVLRDGARAWGRRVDHDLGSLGSLGALLVQFTDTRELGRRMTTLAATASALKGTFPPTGDSLQLRHAMLNDVDVIREDLAAIGAGQSVQTFLIALANELATLDLVDESVLQWIRDRHAETRFRLSLK